MYCTEYTPYVGMVPPKYTGCHHPTCVTIWDLQHLICTTHDYETVVPYTLHVFGHMMADSHCIQSLPYLCSYSASTVYTYSLSEIILVLLVILYIIADAV